MTRIDFYILGDADEDRRQVYLCRLVDKAWRLGNRVWIHAPASAAALDDRLWTFSQNSFLPHERVEDDAVDTSCPVVIGEGREPDEDRQLLVNEDANVPEFRDRFDRVAEVINRDEETRSRARERFAFYRDQGYELHHHEVG